jgi:site-specific recombinase XerD
MTENRNEPEQLRLFEAGGLDLAQLRSMRIALSGVRRSANTAAAYAVDWRQFERWCRAAGREVLPASSDTLALYITWLLTTQNLSISTGARRISAITQHHRAAGIPAPPTIEARALLAAVRRDRNERPRGKRALTVRDLVNASKGCDAKTNLGCRDRALIVLGFATSLRRSELANLNLADITFERRGLAVLVQRSKVDQDGKGRVIGVWAGKRACTDPVRVLRAWIARRGRWEGPLFCRVLPTDEITKRSITGEAVNEAVKRAVASANLDPAQYGAHSLRAGAATTAAELGRSDQEIMDLTGHASAKVMRIYVRHARIFAGRNPLAGAL